MGSSPLDLLAEKKVIIEKEKENKKKEETKVHSMTPHIASQC